MFFMIVDRAMVEEGADRQTDQPQQRRADGESGAERGARRCIEETMVVWHFGGKPAADNAADQPAKPEREPIAPLAGRPLPPCGAIGPQISCECDAAGTERDAKDEPRRRRLAAVIGDRLVIAGRSDEHTSELQNLMR